ncbi:hypothetical protein [Pseudomonas savastanoi]|uniref:Lipoprotein n=3 Tax=Pseudomonas savastanoi TaxID=29438 RepID=A0A0P9QRD6_PSESG|nr:hypothetical protein [Pseudomonas savastanoi]EFW77381.1 hypothetical protein PsgB076_28865 [Pseudomonas savastanoi pv. glycinea str. B076]KPX36946.1 hypothetical protein ALO37_200167 [Pseudomonas savastanoi pv. glycinea]PYD15324.1 hypothetical protein DND36_29260 [Pseudomonas savastanoi pv. glycinea]RMM75997.1 hypothetical protein ALQ75_200114 [Pseudomonas savastanoi pv. glycinea]RMM85837.1 hypothetical protein ALQ70_200162 [Pseudomonas savastanoi pv. glycinea]
MKFKQIGLAVFIASTLGACAIPQQQIVPRVPFPVAKYDHLAASGTGTLTGQVFMRTVGGDVKYGAGSDVYILPVTSYTNQWYAESYIGGKSLGAPDARAEKGMKVTQADGTGYFKFSDVPPGKYYLSSKVTWQVPTQYGLSLQGGVIAKQVVIENNKETREMLTK